jgi:hypothetical protein
MRWYIALVLLTVCVNSHRPYTRMRTPALTSALQSQSSSSTNRTSSAVFNFPPPQQGARFEFTVQCDEWSEYVEPVAYSIQQQQTIVNWHTIRGLQFSGSGRTYVDCLQSLSVIISSSCTALIVNLLRTVPVARYSRLRTCYTQSCIFVIRCFILIV